MIPSDRLNPTAQKVLGYLRCPLLPRLPINRGESKTTNGSLQKPAGSGMSCRLDHSFGAKNKAYLRFAWNNRFQNIGDSNGLPGAVATGVYPPIRQNHFFTADCLHTFNANSIFDLHLSYTRYPNAAKEGPTPFDLSQIGMRVAWTLA